MSKTPLSVILLAASVVALGPGPANASGLLDASGCSDTPSTQVFSRWLDPLSYRLAPGGSFEGDTSGWTMSAGAKVVSGNETYYLNGPTDTHSASLGAGASATSPATCVSLSEPVLRFVVRSTGSALGVLKVDALYRDGSGVLDVTPVGVVTGLGSNWKPSLPMVLSLGYVPSIGQDAADVRLRFTVTGLAGAFQIDDVYIDPFGRG